MKRTLISILLLLSMLCALLPLAVGASADGQSGGNAQADLTYEDFYVKDGLTVLLLSYDADHGVSINANGSGTWQNRVENATLEAAALTGTAFNVLGSYTTKHPVTVVGVEEIVKTASVVKNDENGNPLYRVTTTVYADKLQTTEARYRVTGDDGNLYAATKTVTTVEKWDGLEFTTEGELLMGGWQIGSDGSLGYYLPDFYPAAKFEAHSITLGEGLSALPEESYTVEVVADISRGVSDTDNYPYTQTTGFNNEGDGAWVSAFSLGAYTFQARNASLISPQGTGSLMKGNVCYNTTGDTSHLPTRAGVANFPSLSFLALTFEKAKSNTEYTYTLYKSNQKATAFKTGDAYPNGGATITHIANADVPKGSFALFRNTPAAIYAVRVYNRTLTDAEKQQNHFADLAGYYGFDLSLITPLDDAQRAVVYDTLSILSVGESKDAANSAYQNAIKTITYKPVMNEYDKLYVQDGLTVLLTAFDGEDEESVSLIGGSGSWFNKVQNADGSYSKYPITGVVKTNNYTDESGNPCSTTTGWRYMQGSGIGYDMTLRQTAEIAGQHYIELGVGEVPKDDYTLQVVMNSAGATLEGTEREVKNPLIVDASDPKGYWHERWSYLLKMGNYVMYSKQHIYGSDYGTASLDVFYTAYGAGDWNSGQGQAFKFSMESIDLSSKGILNMNVVRTYPNAKDKSEIKMSVSFRKDALNDVVKGTGAGYDVSGENGTLRLMQDIPGTVYAVRVYNRTLTNDELMQNHFADLCAYYQLDMEAFLNFIPEESRVLIYRRWSTFTFDSHTKEDLQKLLDSSLGSIFLFFDGFSIKTEGSDNELAAIFTANDAEIQKYVAQGFKIEYGVMMARASDVDSIEDLLYGTDNGKIRSVKLYGSDGTGARKYVKEDGTEKTFGYSVFFDPVTSPAELCTPYYFRAYVRIELPDGNILLAHIDAASPYTGTDTSFFEVVRHLKGNVRNYASNAKLAGIIDNIFEPHDLYVDSIKGSDKNDGKTASTAFKTVEAATARAIELINGTVVPIEVNIRLAKGTTYVDNTIEIHGDAISAETYRINYVGHKDGTTLDGTFSVSGSEFSALDDGIYVYELPESLKGTQFRTLYVDGKMATIAMTDWYVAAIDEYSFTDSETNETYWVVYVDPDALDGIIEKAEESASGESYRFANGVDGATMEWFCRMQWYYAALRVVDIDFVQSDTIITGKNNSGVTENKNVMGYIALRLEAGDGDNYQKNHTSVGRLSQHGYNYRLANNIAFLDEGNEFFYDEQGGYLYYIPEDGKSIADLTFGIPLCEELLVLEDINNVTVDSIAFTGVTSNHMTNHGQMAGQAGSLKKVDKTTNREAGWLDDAALQARNVDGLTVTGCSFYELEYSAIYLAGHIKNVQILGNDFEEIGGAAVQAPTTVYNTVVANNYLHNIAVNHLNACAIYFMKASELDILYNSIINSAYTGVSVGWTWAWNYAEYGEKINIHEVEVAYNYLENIMNLTYDGGAVYFNGGAATDNYDYLFNSVHDNYLYIGSREGAPTNEKMSSTAWYMDGAASHTYIYNNVVWVKDSAMTKWSYISLQGNNGWNYDLDALGQQAYRVTVENNYFINLYQDYLTTGYGRVKALFHLYELNSTIFTNKDLYALAEELETKYNNGEKDRHGDTYQEYMLIDPDSFTQTIEDMTQALNVYNIIAAAGCEASADRPWARADAIDLSEYSQKSITNYKDLDNDKSMWDPTYEDGDNVAESARFH